MPKTLSAAAKQAISQAQKKRWRVWRKQQRVRKRNPAPRMFSSLDDVPVVNTPSTNGALAQMNVTLHIQNQTVQLSEQEAASLYEALGTILHRHGVSAT